MAATLVAAALLAPGAARCARVDSSAWRDASLADYRQHLSNLDSLIAACQKQRIPEVCDPNQVGSDDRVEWQSSGITEKREIRYDWLRSLLDRAGKKQAPAQPGAGLVQMQVIKTKHATVDELLALARQRLANDAQQAQQLMRPQPPQTISSVANERKLLATILSRRDYKGVSQTSLRERFAEWLDNLIDDWLGRLMRFGARSHWIPYVLLGLLLASLAIALVLALIRIERHARVRLVPDLPAAGSPSAREWQLWLKDAREMAAQARWREAIHLLYWSAIARLESRRLWPADRARTPREYLRLLPAADPRSANLATLTRSFERTWYGGREAGSSDFQAALALAAQLGVE